MKIPRDIGWRYWLMTIPLIIVGLTGWSIGFVLAMILTTIQAIHFALRERSITAFPVQVRIAYLALLVLGLWGPLSWIHWIQLVGTSMRVAIGYCLLARTVSLLPWNRFESLSMDLLHRTYFSRRGPSCSSRKEEGWGIPMPSISRRAGETKARSGGSMQWEDICRYADQLLFRSLTQNQQAGCVMEQAIWYSPVFDIVSNPVPVSVSVEKK